QGGTAAGSGVAIAGATRRRGRARRRTGAGMIPLLDLHAQYREIGADLESAVIGVLRSGRYVLGEEVTAFERNFADYCGARHGIAVNTGTSALHLSLLAAGIGRGDEVITTPFTFVATVAAILYAGA